MIQIKSLVCFFRTVSFVWFVTFPFAALSSAVEPSAPAHWIFDLDETLIDSMPRRIKSLEVVLNRLPHLSPIGFNRLCPSDAAIQALPNRYDWMPLWRKAGLSVTQARTLHSQMVTEYLSGRWLELDIWLPGMEALLSSLRRRSAVVWFVSSRDQIDQGPGTLLSLRRLGICSDVESCGRIILKQNREESGVDFKKRTAARIHEMARAARTRLIGIVENEPKNLNAMLSAAPDAQGYFVEGASEEKVGFMDPMDLLDEMTQ